MGCDVTHKENKFSSQRKKFPSLYPIKIGNLWYWETASLLRVNNCLWMLLPFFPPIHLASSIRNPLSQLGSNNLVYKLLQLIKRHLSRTLVSNSWIHPQRKPIAGDFAWIIMGGTVDYRECLTLSNMYIHIYRLQQTPPGFEMNKVRAAFECHLWQTGLPVRISVIIFAIIVPNDGQAPYHQIRNAALLYLLWLLPLSTYGTPGQYMKPTFILHSIL